MTSNLKLKQLVAFCILMENNNGILGKSPSYILEKYELTTSSERYLECLLDQMNRVKYRQYLKKWKI